MGLSSLVLHCIPAMAFIFAPGFSVRQVSHRPLSAGTPRRVLLPRLPHPCRLPTLQMTVTVGSPAVDFSLPISGGGTLSSADLQSKATSVIIYFYPRDATPGCTTEAKDFRGLKPELDELNATVVGVSRDSVESHDAFVKDLDLNFPLITDDGTLTEGYGVWKVSVYSRFATHSLSPFVKHEPDILLRSFS